jgi:hypothetical protein
MARHNSEARVCRWVNSSNCSRHTLSDSSRCCSASAATLDKPWEFSSATSHARCASSSSPSRRTIFWTRPYASSLGEASTATLSAYTLNTLSETPSLPRWPSPRILDENHGATPMLMRPPEQRSLQQVPSRCEQFLQQRLPPAPGSPPPTMWARSHCPRTGAAGAKIGGNVRTRREPEAHRQTFLYSN